MGETQEIIFDTAVVFLFVVLFFLAQRGRKDLRLLCWMAGWVGVVIHFAAEIFLTLSSQPNAALSALSMNALALVATCFVVSTMIQAEGQRVAGRLFAGLLLTTCICQTLSMTSVQEWWLIAAVVVRQGVVTALAARKRRRRPVVGTIIGSIALLTALWMVVGIWRGYPEVVAPVLLGEMFLVSAIDFWANGWTRTPALRLLIAGLVAWSAVFPVSLLLSEYWPGLLIDREVWNLPKFCVAVGMILVLMEEDTRAARALNADYRLLFETNPQGLWIIDVEALTVVAVNESALNMHGFSRGEFLGKKISDVIAPEMRDWAVAQLRSATPQANRGARHLRKDGSMISLDLTAYDITFEGRHCRFVMAVDASEREALGRELDRTIHYDQLTGLPNRRSFPELLTEVVYQALAAGEKVAVLSLDFDRFKDVNEMYGLRVADEYIQRVAEVLTTRMRSSDIIARTAGDEFTIVLTGLKSTQTAEQAARELMDVFQEPLLVQGYKVQRHVSIGAAIAPDNGKDPMALWRGSESARSQAKLQGGNRTVWLSEELFQAAEERRMLEEHVRNRLSDGGFYLLYQPLYGADGQVRGLEALLRLAHPTLGAISPVRLVPIAEESGLILDLGNWVLEEVCRQLLKWRSEGVEPVPVAVNVSVLQLMHENYARGLMAILARYAIEPQLVHLEVTESVAMQNVAEVSERMAALAAMGIHFSIDDFGTGHSSLARLSQLATSELKIDRSFLEPGCMGTSHSIVQAIITMAHALGHVVVAEGVENEMQLQCLREMHCDLYQGYLLSRPVTASAIPALIATRHPVMTASGGPLWRESPRPRLVSER
jgi:diguanylate cyclase (GGDEF)-like protein/PAS domain S-box-containing protein